MQDILINEFHDYIAGDHPDLLVNLQLEGRATEYLQQKVNALEPLWKQLQLGDNPSYIIEELCMNELRMDLGPSKYDYLAAILEEEFPAQLEQFRKNGVLTYEIMNLMEGCDQVFESFEFSDMNSDSRLLRYAIIGSIGEYLELS